MKNKFSKSFLVCGLAISLPVFGVAQEKVVNDSIQHTALNEIVLSATHIDEKTPIAFTNVSKRELSKRNLGQDIPSLLGLLPSVVTTTDAGAGIGYSSFRVRGSDATRVNVTLNGIPYNDGESQGSFWVNMPDFTSSVQNIQLQRGVGTSTNGAAAFGASLNLNTDEFSHEANGEISNSFGSYNTRKSTAKFSTGLINNKFELAGRLSDMKSDGYIDRASADMKSYFLQGAYVGETTMIKALVFGGKQKTYQAWSGVYQDDLDKYGRRYNPAGKYKDDNGNEQFYKNETDNYIQKHYQLHWTERWNDAWSSNVSLHYTKGDGYYENYKKKQDLESYGLSPVIVDGKDIRESDLIRRKHLDNHFYGMVFNTKYATDKLSVVLGGGANKYEGDHFGEILWVKEAVKHSYKQEYYRDDAVKTDMNFYAKATWQFVDKWSLFGDMQYRRVTYEANGIETGLVNDKFNFFNPKGGITYQLDNQNQFYFSYARANREPNRKDYEGLGKPKAEKLNDYELGWRHKGERASINVNAYLMDYKDQLILTGEINDVGGMLRANSGDSYRLGLEVEANVKVLDKVYWSPSLTISTNKNKNFKTNIDEQSVNLGTTNIAFSPDFIASNTLTYLPIKGMSVSLLTKFVGEQYMANIDAKESKLDSYFINDLNATYEFPIKGWVKSIGVSVLANNIFNVKYISNGYYDTDWGPAYYSQAEFNILGGVTIKF
ncbi:TonB-dependent receptor [Myroides albus]|uniref:TonB-dependent receptor n=1 Tax=Myroides albus TaxID=2562892 RepID=A0A6I3LJM2_9FLAO|nr:TonB-dependent receptor [Myroides albus]MTG98463.1 TonB-dependent receptor [Myroides albus]UVD78220.1 TonB-dependent receptor [Myroides albus]